MRKVAIWALVTGWSGQYRSGSVAQPEVISAANRASMPAACTLLGSTSANLVPAAGSGSGAPPPPPPPPPPPVKPGLVGAAVTVMVTAMLSSVERSLW